MEDCWECRVSGAGVFSFVSGMLLYQRQGMRIPSDRRRMAIISAAFAAAAVARLLVPPPSGDE